MTRDSLRNKGAIFEAQLETVSPSVWRVKENSLIEATGVCVVQTDERRHPRSFRLLLRSADDLKLLEMPPSAPRWNTRDLLKVLGTAAIIIVAALGWGLMLHRRVREQAERISILNREAELRERYRALFASIQDVFYRADLDGRILLVSPSCQRVLGYSPEELAGRSTSEVCVTPNERERLLALLLEHGSVTDHEMLLRRKDGEQITVSLSAHVVRETNGRVTATEGFIRDITARKRAEDALRESEQLLASVTHNISEGIYRSTPEKGLVYVNEAFARMFGYDSAEEIKKVPSRDLYVEPQRRLELIDLIERHGFFRNEEVEFKRKDGSRFWGLASSIGIYDPQSREVIYFDGAITDITERKRIEQERLQLNQELEQRIAGRTQELVAANEALRASEQRLRESEERVRKMFRGIPALVSIVRLSDHRYVEVNENFEDVSGYAKEEIIGHTPLELGFWPEPEQRAEFIRQLQEHGFVRNFECKFRARSGRIDTILISAERIEIDYEPHILGLSLPISERKRAEAELLKALAREKELGELKSSFVSMVSHEFRTPLGIIMSSSEILGRYLMRLTPEQREEHLQAIHKSVKRMVGMMEEVLLLGKVEAGRMECKPVPLDVVGFCRRLTDEMLSVTNRKCPIHFEANDVPSAAEADESLLRHMFTNLLSNAVKYSSPGSPVIFRLRTEEGLAVFKVKDQGVGIPVADRDRMFKAFFRSVNVSHVPGTGLGLTIVKRCVDLHGGRISFESTEGVGTIFTVRLPLFGQPVTYRPGDVSRETTIYIKTPREASAAPAAEMPTRSNDG